MQYRQLGRTGLMVSEVGLGGWAFGGPFRLHGIASGWADQRDADSLATIEAARAAGINFIDTADVYGLGHSEEVIGQAIRGQRQDWIVATKFGHAPWDKNAYRSAYAAGNVTASCEGSLKRLGIDCIDLYQWHGPADPGFEAESLEAVLALRKAGKVRFIGLSFYMLRELESALKVVPPIDAIQVEFNLRWTYTREQGIFKMAQDRGWGVVVKSPLHGSMLTGKHSADTQFGKNDLRGDRRGVARHFADRKRFLENLDFVERLRFLERPGRTLAQAALRYVLDEPVVSTIIPGARRVEHLQQNAAAADLAPLTGEEHQKIVQVQSQFQCDAGW
ncbi:MAG: aldo/keto reductase [Planctomycetota bacterium]